MGTLSFLAPILGWVSGCKSEGLTKKEVVGNPTWGIIRGASTCGKRFLNDPSFYCLSRYCTS